VELILVEAADGADVALFSVPVAVLVAVCGEADVNGSGEGKSFMDETKLWRNE
jgi:prephenate dehydrogenase